MIHSSHQLLELPLQERRVLVVLPDDVLRMIEQQARTDRAAPLPEHAYGGAEAGRAEARSRTEDRLSSAATTASVVPARVLVPALAVGVLGLAAAAYFTRGRGLPLGVKVVSASVAQDLTFDEGPFEIGEVYAAHPMVHGRYLPHRSYPRIILQERARETETFLLSCGASRIEMTVEHGEDLSFSAGAGYTEPRGAVSGKLRAKRKENAKRRTVIQAPGRPAPDSLVPSAWTWFEAEPEWQEIHRRRSNSGITGYELTTEITDDRLLDLEAIAKIPGVKLTGNASVSRLDKTTWKWKVAFPPAAPVV